MNIHDYFVLASSVVGATIVAIGTTTPELSVSISSVRKGYYHMLFGNIIGSNVANTLLLLGIGAVIHPITLTGVVLATTLPILIISTVLFAFRLSTKGVVSKFRGMLLLGLYIAFVALLWIIR